jgi:glutaredoxin-like protein NrdH
MKFKQVTGENRGKIMLFALSTCVWCKKTKKLLDQEGVTYLFADLDRLEGEEKDEAVGELKRWNPKLSFPTLVINDKDCIVGYKEEKIKKAIGK